MGRRYYSSGQKRKAQPRKEWDEFLLHVRQQFGCDSKTIHSCYRVERRYLAHSMKMVVYCDWDPPRQGEFELGYVEIHEDGLVSYEYEDWLKDWSGTHGEEFVRMTDLQWRQKADDFLASLRRAADNTREGEREKERVRRAEAERKRLIAEEEKQRLDAIRLKDEAERRRVRRVKEAARRKQQREEEQRREAERQARLVELNRRLAVEQAERDRQAAERRREQERLDAIRREEEARLKAIEDAKQERKRAREALWKKDAEDRRRAFAEVGIVIPSDEELAKLLEPPPPQPWRPHPGDLILTAGGIGGLLYWLLFL